MDASDLDLDGDGPLYLQIKRAIAGAVLAGAAQPGQRIPAERELMDRFKASRMTVNKALSQLAREGLLRRNRRAGTVVAPRGPERAVFEIWDVCAEAASAGAPYRFEVIERVSRPADAGDQRRLAVAGGRPVLWVLGRHHINGAVVQLEERLIDIAAAPGIADADFGETPPGRWLLDHVPWSEAEHTIRAVNAGAPHAGLLDVPDGTAVLVVERRTWHGPRPITYVRLWTPGDRHVLVGRFAPLG